MLSLTGTTLFVVAVVGAVVALLAAGAVAVLRSPGRWRGRLLARALPVVVLVVVGQLLAMTALALKVNDTYDFYTSWADLTGQVAQGSTIQTAGLLGNGQGQVQVADVHDHVGRDQQTMVWLPPQYTQPAYRTHRFPVVMFLSGQPSSPQIAFHQYQFGQVATQLIAQHKVAPFIAVFPTLMIDPPRDTECTNVPNGPQAETWLAHDVPAWVQQHYRVVPQGPQWSVMGWSTGGFCAAKLVTADTGRFGSAVSFGGYYQPVQDHTTGSLFAGRRRLALQNSPEWLYLHRGGLHGGRLLLVAGQQDHETWGSTNAMIRATAGDPSVAHIAFPVGGHNYHNYSAYLGQALSWAGRGWTAGTPL